MGHITKHNIYAIRFKSENQTEKVKVGSTTIGGDAPIRIQSMTTTNTCDVEASIAQSTKAIKEVRTSKANCSKYKRR